MLPFWRITEKFIGGAMPRTTSFEQIVRDQQIFLDNNGYNINYESNWITPWGSITDQEYTEYYWNNNAAYSYLANDHIIAFWSGSDIQRQEVNKIKSKLEQYIASSDVSRIISHNNWGEYGHHHHVAINIAARELAVKYRKDVWMLGCNNGDFIDVTVPDGITYTIGSFNTPSLYTGIRSIYYTYGRWTGSSQVPSGDHKFIKIVENGVDKSNILTGQSITTSGPYQDAPGAYIFDGSDDYMTLGGNNHSSFTIAMRIRPGQIRAMDIAKMTEYPSSGTYDRNFYLNSNGQVSARIYDGSSRIVTSNSSLAADSWVHIAMTSNRSNLKIYVNGVLENTISAGTAITGYSSPEFVLGQKTMTGSFFNGQISDVRLFDYALSDSEIAGLVGTGITIYASAGSGGTINPSGISTVDSGTDKTYTITPNSGYQISDVKVDNVSVGPISTYTFNNVTTSHTIAATFDPITHTITSSSGTGGSISPSGSVAVNHGTNRKFTISANTGYQISDVMVDDASVGSVTTYTFNNVTSDHSISATFKIATYTLTSSAGTGGSISPSGIITVNHGTNRTFTITPNPGYEITDVRVDDESIGTPSTYSFNNISADHTISATFSIITFTIISSAGTGGTISPTGNITVNTGTSRTFTITASIGYYLTDVKIDNVSVGSVTSYTFTNITDDHEISATFSPITYTITSSSGTGGSISPAGSVVVNHGTNRRFTISANTGYQISDVLVDDVSIGSVSTYTFNNVTSDHSISATFKIATYTLTSSAGTGGAISPSGIITVNHGTNRTYTITPDIGYEITNVRVDNVSVGTPSTYTFNNISANHTISATFSIITYTIVSSAGTGGTISPSGNVTVNYGTSRTFAITANSGYYIADVKIDNVSVGSVTTYTFNNVKNDHTISASFAIITYKITSSAGTGGSISPNGTVTVNYGTNNTYTVIPETGCRVLDVLVDNISVGAVSKYTFNNTKANHNISATFTPITYTITSIAETGGSIDPIGTVTVNHGTNHTYTITPDTGYEITNVKVDGNSIGVVSTYTFNDIIKNHTISSTFKIKSYTLTGNAGTGGSISPAGNVKVNHGTDQTFTVTPDNGYKIADIKIDGSSVKADTSYTFDNVTADHNISVTFRLINTYKITASSGIGGFINPSDTVTILEDGEQIYTITPEVGFRILNVIVDHQPVGSVSDYTFTDIIANHRITATFTTTIGVNVSPNPFEDEFKVKIDSPSGLVFNLSVADLAGKVIFSLSNIPGNTITPINLQASRGYYILRVYRKTNKIATIKIVKY
jgi:hypothetical protein